MKVVKGQQGPAVVLEAGIDSQQPELVGEVAQPHGQGVLAAIDRAGVHEGRERIDLVADGDVAPGARWAGAKEGDAVLLVLDSRVIRWDLRHRETLVWRLLVRTVGICGSHPAEENSGLFHLQGIFSRPLRITGAQPAERLRLRGDKKYTERFRVDKASTLSDLCAFFF